MKLESWQWRQAGPLQPGMISLGDLARNGRKSLGQNISSNETMPVDFTASTIALG